MDLRPILEGESMRPDRLEVGEEEEGGHGWFYDFYLGWVVVLLNEMGKTVRGADLGGHQEPSFGNLNDNLKFWKYFRLLRDYKVRRQPRTEPQEFFHLEACGEEVITEAGEKPGEWGVEKAKWQWQAPLKERVMNNVGGHWETMWGEDCSESIGFCFEESYLSLRAWAELSGDIRPYWVEKWMEGEDVREHVHTSLWRAVDCVGSGSKNSGEQLISVVSSLKKWERWYPDTQWLI